MGVLFMISIATMWRFALAICLATFGQSDVVAQTANSGTYTYYRIPDKLSGQVVHVSVEVAVVALADAITQEGLFFPSLQVNLGPKVRGENEGGHIGLQYVGGKKATNWGGYFAEYAVPTAAFPPLFDRNLVPDDDKLLGNKVGYKMTDPEHGDYTVLVEHFDPGTYTQVNHREADFLDWQIGKKYRLLVYRGSKVGGYWEWKGFLQDFGEQPTKNYFVGTLYSSSSYIESLLVWVETDFNDDRKFDVRFTNPRCRATCDGPLEAESPSAVAPEIHVLDAARNTHNSVVCPTNSNWTQDDRTTWHRNGIPTPEDAYRVKLYESPSR
jgi:hypothetical protein